MYTHKCVVIWGGEKIKREVKCSDNTFFLKVID